MKSPSSSFTSNECIASSKIVPSGCLTGVFRRFLGYVYVSKKPVDRFQELQKDTEGVEELGNVGLVAKLMGLDSMPRVELGSDKKNLKSITRSRSMNSAETLSGFDQKNRKHRRVRSSTFLKEGSGYLEFENDNFFVISFEKGTQIEKFRSELRNSDVGFGELRQKRSEKSRTKSKKREKMNQEYQEPNKNCVWGDGNFEDSKKVLDPIKNSQENARIGMEVVKKTKPMQAKSRSDRRKSRKNRKENCSPIKKLDSDCDSENSSPISVLDYVQIPVNNSSDKDSTLTCLNSRRKLSKKLDKLDQFSRNDSKSTISDLEENKIEAKLDGLRWKESTNYNCQELWGEICKLAEKDTMQCNFMFKEDSKSKDSEEICINFGFEILDQLLIELLVELAFT